MELAATRTPLESQSITPSRTENVLPQKEKEVPRVVKVLRTAHARFEAAFLKSREDGGTPSEEEIVDFVGLNTQFHKTDEGTKLHVESYMSPEGRRRSIRTHVPVDGLIRFYDRAILSSSDETERMTLEEERRVLLENSKPFLRNENRREQLDEIVRRQSELIARAITGSDSDAHLFITQATERVMNGRELVVPNPLVRAEVGDVLLQTNTVDDLLQRIDAVAPSSDIFSGGHVLTGSDPLSRTPTDEARRAIAQNNEMIAAKEARERAAEVARAERNAAIVRGNLSLVRPSQELDVPRRTNTMNEQVAAMNKAVEKLSAPLLIEEDQYPQESIAVDPANSPHEAESSIDPMQSAGRAEDFPGESVTVPPENVLPLVASVSNLPETDNKGVGDATSLILRTPEARQTIEQPPVSPVSVVGDTAGSIDQKSKEDQVSPKPVGLLARFKNFFSLAA